MDNPKGRCHDCYYLLGCPGLMSCRGFVHKNSIAPDLHEQKHPPFPAFMKYIEDFAAFNKPTGKKYDQGKQPWYAMPLEVLEPLADVFAEGVQEYGLFNCLERFENSNERFYDAQMRHTRASQLDPLARDMKSGNFELAKVAFNALIRLYQARRDVK